MMMDTAYLTKQGDYIAFTYLDKTIRFLASEALEYIKEVKEWDHGYLVVNAKYRHSDELTEDYIDLNYILQELYQDDVRFLEPIKRVEVKEIFEK